MLSAVSTTNGEDAILFSISSWSMFFSASGKILVCYHGYAEVGVSYTLDDPEETQLQ